MWRQMIGVGCGAVLALGAVSPPAQAAEAASAAACTAYAGSVTAAGGHGTRKVTATTPPAAGAVSTTTGVYSPGTVRATSHWEDYLKSGGGSTKHGYVIIGDSLYRSGYATNGLNQLEGPPYLTRIGGGWSKFSLVEWATYDTVEAGDVTRTEVYALRTDGVLFRWHVTDSGWRATGSYPGFSAVKTMAVISKQPTYDTFLANTRGGALYTIRIPVSSPMKPVVKQVRSRTWQGFETLIANKCGQYGTLLLGIDKDAQSGYLYAVGHANGTSTVINSLGKVPATFNDPIDFRWAGVAFYDALNGE
ncbi:hypothetical protein [Kribbella sp. CA-247076]|uniref:hypothetical protein n=1 Tax=Kribbella sp. CA-247076 TaxID=3239941 RepID=UPI003D8B51E5